jgi:hypothetical protein
MTCRRSLPDRLRCGETPVPTEAEWKAPPISPRLDRRGSLLPAEQADAPSLSAAIGQPRTFATFATFAMQGGAPERPLISEASRGSRRRPLLDRPDLRSPQATGPRPTAQPDDARNWVRGSSCITPGPRGILGIAEARRRSARGMACRIVTKHGPGCLDGSGGRGSIFDGHLHSSRTSHRWTRISSRNC